MFEKMPDPVECPKVRDILHRWANTLAEIDNATNAMRLVMTQQPLGMQSPEFEKARLAAVTVVGEAQKETSNLKYWPILTDTKGALYILELKSKLEESYNYQLLILSLYGKAAAAFRAGKNPEAPVKEVLSTQDAFGQILKEMGSISSKLGRRYHLSTQEVQKSLQR